MTDLIPGKRYRWTVEGVATRRGGLRIDDSTPLDVVWLTAGTIEQLPDPLPATPGSVVQWQDPANAIVIRCVRTASSVSPWTPVSVVGRIYYSDAELTGATVLFDAGAEQ